MNDSIDVTLLAQRIGKLERQNRLFKVAALVALLVGASMFLIAARPANVVTAERFVVQDASGKTLATLGADTDGLPGLSIKDTVTGKERAWLGLWNKGQEVSLGFFDQNSKERSRLGILASGITRLSIDDENGKLRAYVQANVQDRDVGGFVDESTTSSSCGTCGIETSALSK